MLAIKSTAFLVDFNGNVIKRYAPATKPESLEAKIKEFVNQVNLEVAIIAAR